MFRCICRDALCGWEVDGSGSVTRPVVGFAVNSVEPSGSTTRHLLG